MSSKTETLNLKYTYGPVASWRLGSSLGVDLLSGKEKICTYNCIYCQLGRKVIYTLERKNFVPVDRIIKEIESLPEINIDYITFSGRGEPTIASNLSETVRAIKNIRKEKIAILTNSSLMYREDVKKDLLSFDFVIAKLDATSHFLFEKINYPARKLSLEKIMQSLIDFRKEFHGKFALQIMFINLNKAQAQEIAEFARLVKPDEVQINTPLRPCPVPPLSREEIAKIKEYFTNLNAITVYESKIKKVTPISKKETMERRGKVI
ncbi:MAG: hypothetical protein DRP91_07800 [Candidatus Neomarinimicrobiota bacterium]|nr:radical SAM protein [Candidatus Neomarinimicrobiota bacterium]RKY47303.1 MAG: hypothetical protein DRP91_07800 [Candidatus Neomarinimicrobiota bacterium]